LLNSLPPTTPLEANDWNYLVTGVVKNELLGAAPLWVAARLVDFLIGGPAKRKARKKSGLAQLLQEGERLGNGNETAELPVAAMN
jgi:hypothetical protein